MSHSEPQASARGKSQIVAEERVLVERAILVTGRTRIVHRTVADLDAHKQSARRKQFEATTKFIVQKGSIAELA